MSIHGYRLVYRLHFYLFASELPFETKGASVSAFRTAPGGHNTNTYRHWVAEEADGPRTFEKSLLDLIRGLRYHKGNEKEYIQKSLKECRAEVRSQDMDVKATALLKLVYLEMVGHDMSWASFHVLEVMSSQKLHQKRIGYLAAVQSFRTDTEVLMLATNLLKKDLCSSSPVTIQLPIAALPHLITPSLAMSVLPDLLPRLNHSHRVIRKKTIVTLYRMALVFPETLRAAWPKIKDRLMDPTEDPSVTAAIVNVICELGWRRPQDFLPLAPRLFELLVDGGNNWMAIKLIKLFATLTPLEPRLVRKLLPPLTDIIRTTPAMSLLYECINGIIQGGILGSDDDISGREEIASLCVTKLRGMIMVHDDPNLKYVALIAFNKIVSTHSFLVSEQEDVIMECIDSQDISIRIKALDLVQGMVSSDNLMSIVGRLMRQLKQSTSAAPKKTTEVRQLEFRADSDDEAEAAAQPKSQEALLPEDYKIDVMHRILSMCAQNNYSNIADFDWYIDILTQLLRTAPPSRGGDSDGGGDSDSTDANNGPWYVRTGSTDISERVGNELRNVAVKVRAMRAAAVGAANSVIGQLSTEAASATTVQVTTRSLRPMVWMVGEYAELLESAEDTLSLLLQLVPRIRAAEVLATCVQALAKLFAFVAGNDAPGGWQERAVELSELLRLADEAASAQSPSIEGVQQDAPLLLTEAIPSLFRGWELNSVAAGAQLNIPLPQGLDLDEPIHANLGALLAAAAAADQDGGQITTGGVNDDDDFDAYYYQTAAPASISSAEMPAISRLPEGPEAGSSYQQQQQQAPDEEAYLDADILARRKAEREERYRDDPFYIQGSGGKGLRTSTPIHDILTKENGQDLDIDSIPVMQLDLQALGAAKARPSGATGQPHQARARPKRIVVAADEMLAGSGRSTPRSLESDVSSDGRQQPRRKTTKHQQSLLQVDSSYIGTLSLEEVAGDGEGGGSGSSRAIASSYDYERQRRADAEMAQALKEVEKRRLEMQRANERVQMAQGIPIEGVVVVRKKKKTATKKAVGTADGEVVATKPKKKAAAAAAEATTEASAAETTVIAKPKKKKGRRIVDLGGEEPGL
ncbi:ap-3 complex subunit [Grosmannia clavigera kw1407]|uniref:AP-3 complex subunit delta n=1 Tax=Grosmannia clavigera (strain kw1407 / UAMH 11150) TaxID=655863 RepID=F0XMA0_GROCL|nr:ap-3 complex subunit [Grosmannia clavigera kw1407]EFX01470.1 ap-3 complex subunit [Grosmannia clavigera kw1407]